MSVGQGGLTKVQVQAADGAGAEVYCHGAHLTSWRTADGEEQLFLSSAAQFKPGGAIRGGVPIIFPQFAAVGPLLKHGFARAVEWQYLGACDGDPACAMFSLDASPATHEHWPFGFHLEYRVRVGGKRLQLMLRVTNTDTRPFNFTVALHTYLKVDALNALSVRGLHALRYRDSAAGGVERVESAAAVRIDGEVDRIYLAAGEPVMVDEPVRRMQIDMQGFRDTVVWNPGAHKAAALSDLEVDGFRRMVCVEAAVIEHPVTLSPGATWQGAQILTRC